MGLFSKQQSYLGIDFDKDSVKVVELKNEDGRPRLVTYGYLDQEIERGKLGDEAGGRNEHLAITKLITQVCHQANTTTNKVITALPAYSVFTSILNLPALSKKDLASAVKRSEERRVGKECR